MNFYVFQLSTEIFNSLAFSDDQLYYKFKHNLVYWKNIFLYAIFRSRDLKNLQDKMEINIFDI